MNKRVTWFSRILSIVLPLMVVAIGVWGMLALANRKIEPRSPRGAAEPPLVTTVEVVTHTGGLDLELEGVVTPFREITLAAEVPGRVIRKVDNCRAGRFVTRGEVLMEIDPKDYELQVQQLERQLAQAGSNLEDLSVEQSNTDALIESAREDLELQQVDLKRVENLRGSLSDSEVDKVRRTEWVSRNALLILRNQLQLLRSRRRGLESAKELVESQLEKARLDLQRTIVRAPADGLIVRENVEQDSYVQKGAEMVVVEDTSRVEVKCNLQMEDLQWIWNQTAVSTSASADASATESVAASYALPKTPATVMYQPIHNLATYKWQGELSRFDGIGMDEKTRTAPCRVTVAEPQNVLVEANGAAEFPGGPKALMRGMYVHVLVHTQPQNEFLQVPEASIQPGKKILRVRSGKLEFVGPVVLAKRIDQRTGSETQTRKYFLVPTSESGLQAGDHVVNSPLAIAEPGMVVREQLERSLSSETRTVKGDDLRAKIRTPANQDIL